jgi:hypothetical protein
VHPEDTGDFGVSAPGREHGDDFGSLPRHELGSPPAFSALLARCLFARAPIVADSGVTG